VRAVRTALFPAKTVDLSVRKGEILGLAGLVGSGRTELARAIFGVDAIFGGEFRMAGKTFRPRHPADSVKEGIFLVPEDRKAMGVLLDLPILENISLPNLPAYASNFIVSRPKETATAQAQRHNLGIKTPNVLTRTGALSGGNQQKVVLGKWLAMSPKVMIFDEPTRGIDVGAKAEIYRLMRDLADRGVALLMISSDMEEVIGVSDRVAVMHEGHIAGIVEGEALNQENIMRLAVGRAPAYAATAG
jgi:ribose transport system ATP-binding protein